MLACEAMDEDRNVVLEPCSGEQSPSFVFDFVSDFRWRGVFELDLEHVLAVHEFQLSTALGLRISSVPATEGCTCMRVSSTR